MTPEDENDDEVESGFGRASEAGSRPSGRTFLCVVDESEELHQALRYACRRARHTSGHVALLYVIEPAQYQHWMAVSNLMAKEQREQAEELLQVVSSVVQKLSGKTPVIYIREGNLPDNLMQILGSEPDLSVLVLGAASGSDGPGRMVSYVMKRIGRLPVPVTIVPGGLSDEQIDAIT